MKVVQGAIARGNTEIAKELLSLWGFIEVTPGVWRNGEDEFKMEA